MKKNFLAQDTYSMLSVTSSNQAIMQVLITADIHEIGSLSNEATMLVYPEMLLSGTKSLTRAAFLDRVNQLGASLTVTTSHGRVHFSLTATTVTAARLFKLFSALISEPTFTAFELKRVKTLVKNDLHQSKDNSKAIAEQSLKNSLFGSGDRRHAHAIADTEAAVANVTSKDLRVVHSRMQEAKWTVSITADAATVTKCERTIQNLKKKSPIPKKSVHQPRPLKQKLHLLSVPSRQNIDYSIGLPIPLTVDDADYCALSFGVAVLAKWGGFAGRLMSTIREKEGFTYGIYGRIESATRSEQGYLRIMTFFAPEKSVAALGATVREIKKIAERGITEKEFQAFKTILATQEQLLYDSPTRLLADLHGYHASGFTLDHITAHKAQYQALTRREINQALKTYLTLDRLYVCGAGPVTRVEKDIVRWFKSMS